MYRAGLSVNFLFRIVCFKFAGIPPKAGRRLFLRLFFGFLYGFLFGKFFAQEPEHRPQRVADQSEEKKGAAHNVERKVESSCDKSNYRYYKATVGDYPQILRISGMINPVG